MAYADENVKNSRFRAAQLDLSFTPRAPGRIADETCGPVSGFSHSLSSNSMLFILPLDIALHDTLTLNIGLAVANCSSLPLAVTCLGIRSLAINSDGAAVSQDNCCGLSLAVSMSPLRLQLDIKTKTYTLSAQRCHEH